MTPEHVRWVIAPLMDLKRTDIGKFIILAERIHPEPGIAVTSDLNVGEDMSHTEEVELLLVERLQRVIRMMSCPDADSVWSLLPEVRS